MGYKILKKNKSLIEQITEENTIYEIRYNFTLTGDITIPANCILKFDGGSISGTYTITGNNTGINAGLTKIFNTNVTLEGKWSITEIYPEWFGAKRDYNYTTNVGTDSSSAFNVAIAFAEGCNIKKVKIGTGYNIANPVYINKGGIIIEGISGFLTENERTNWEFSQEYYGIYSNTNKVFVVSESAYQFITFRDINCTNPYLKNTNYSSVCISYESKYQGPIGPFIIEGCHFMGYDKAIHVVNNTDFIYRVAFMTIRNCAAFANNYVVYMDDYPNGTPSDTSVLETLGIVIEHCRLHANGQIFRGGCCNQNIVFRDINIESPNLYVIPYYTYNPGTLHPAQYIFDVRVALNSSVVFENLYGENIEKKIAVVRGIGGQNKHAINLYATDINASDNLHPENHVIECEGDDTIHVFTDWKFLGVYGNAPIVYHTFQPKHYSTAYPKWNTYLDNTINVKAVALSNISLLKNYNSINSVESSTDDIDLNFIPLKVNNVPSIGKIPMYDFSGVKTQNLYTVNTVIIDVSGNVPDYVRSSFVTYSTFNMIYFNVYIELLDSNNRRLEEIILYNRRATLINNQYCLVSVIYNIKEYKKTYGNSINKIRADIKGINLGAFEGAGTQKTLYSSNWYDTFNENDNVDMFCIPPSFFGTLRKGITLNAGDKIIKYNGTAYSSNVDIVECIASGTYSAGDITGFSFTATDNRTIQVTSSVNYVGLGTMFDSNGITYTVIDFVREDAAGTVKYIVNHDIISGTGVLHNPTLVINGTPV